jgi:hypothetical protein
MSSRWTFCLALLLLGCRFELPPVAPEGDGGPPDSPGTAERGADVTLPADAQTAGGQVCSQDDWCWENPLPTGNTLYDVTGSETDLWVAGHRTILHHDGERWSHVTYYVGGDLLRFLDDPHGGFYLVSSGDGVLHFDGQIWTVQHKVDFLRDIADNGAGEIFAVGGRGVSTVGAHYKAGSWSAMSLPAGTQQLNGVWGGGGEAFAVGEKGVILHHDGSSWSAMSSGTPERLNAVWGSGPADVYAVGSGGTILHHDGGSWKPVGCPKSVELLAIWGRGAGDAFVVGRGGTILRLQGAAWTLMSSPVTADLTGVRGVGASVWATGGAGTLLRHDGAGWTEVSSAVTRGNVRDAHGCGGEVFAVVHNGGGAVLRRAAGSWSAVHKTSHFLEGVFALDTDSVWAVGWNGVILRYDGVAWSSVTSGTIQRLWDIWGDGPSNLYAVGDGGTILRFDGSSWTQITVSGVTAPLHDVTGTASGEIFAVGAKGTVVRLKGGAWAQDPSGTSLDLNGVWAAGPKAVFAVGDSGTVLRYDGAGWGAVVTPFTESLEAVWGRGADDLYVVGYGGHVAHYDGKGWTELKTGASSWLNAVWGNAAGVWVLGAPGAIIHHL